MVYRNKLVTPVTDLKISSNPCLYSSTVIVVIEFSRCIPAKIDKTALGIDMQATTGLQYVHNNMQLPGACRNTCSHA